jgi:hypothetical protein
MPSEIWRQVVGLETFYEVSDQGRVRSLGRLVRCRGGKTKLTCSCSRGIVPSKRPSAISMATPARRGDWLRTFRDRSCRPDGRNRWTTLLGAAGGGAVRGLAARQRQGRGAECLRGGGEEGRKGAEMHDQCASAGGSGVRRVGSAGHPRARTRR